MNVCQIITPSKIAGAERSTASLCEHLQKAGHRVVIGCKQGSPLIDLMREMGLDARPLAISGKANLLAPSRIAALIRETRSSVVHSHLSTAALHGATAGRLAGVPSVAHVRALNSPFCYRGATRVIAVSHAVKVHLVRGGLESARIDVVYNGVDPDRYYLPCTREEARARLGLPGEALLFGVVAHLTQKKGHALFLDALAQVAAQVPEARALFLGDGDARPALRRQAAELGIGDRVIWAGFQKDVLPYYAAMDAVVLPSREGEGLPRALLEGGLLGLPTIGSRLSGVPEIIRDGETGFIFELGDPAGLAEHMRALAGDAGLRSRMGRAAREWIASAFTIHAMIEGTLAAYRRAGAVA
jgi:glycosyltransferase involved in cell wall biosynthesis